MGTRRRLTRGQAILAAVAVVAGVAVAATGIVLGNQPEPVEPPRIVAAPEPSVAPVEDPGFAANTEVYALAALPTVNVFSLARSLPVDDNPGGDVLDLFATPHDPGAPLFADPTGAPVGTFAAQFQYDGTTVPVIEKQANWVRVMVSGRAGLPSEGIVGQLTAWMRTADVELTSNTLSVQVSLTGSRIAILDGDTVVYETGSFAIGAPATPTPVGRTFIMTSRPDAGAGYTRGHPLVYLGVQSETLDGFNGANNAITAFHYHDARSGAISNGCLRVDVEAITQLAALPLGTPVFILP